MSLLKNKHIKYNLLSFDELVINLDRLSRFKLPEDSFNRVFSSIIFKHLLVPKYTKADIEKMDAKCLANIVKEIWNASVKKICNSENKSQIPNKALSLIIEKTFKNIDERTRVLIKTKLDISPLLEKIDYKTSPENIKFLIKVNEEINSITDLNIENLIDLRKKYKLLFPIQKLVIVEGITEETLLPVFADKLNANFKANGIFVLGAGGKSKSPSLYIQLKNKLKIPVILLFDSDAKEICSSLSKNIDKKDKAILIENGEFEDIMSINLLKRALNAEYQPATPIIKEDLHLYSKMCENIENFYRTRHLGEFKKSKLSKIIAQNVKYDTDITDEIKKIIHSIV